MSQVRQLFIAWQKNILPCLGKSVILQSKKKFYEKGNLLFTLIIFNIIILFL